MAAPADLLPAVFRQSNEIRARIKQLLGNPRAALGNLEADAATVMDQVRADSYSNIAAKRPEQAARMYPQQARNAPAFNRQLAQQHMDRINEMVLNGMTVWHGSPHKFDKFDMSKIGTGEGAQAYGHGLYFAENPAVANTYQQTAPYLGRHTAQLAQQAQDEAKKLAKPGEDLMAVTQRVLHEKYTANKDPYLRMPLMDAMNNVRELLKPSGGNLYKVDLPDEHIAKMLDWDKPLSGQPHGEKLLAAYKELEATRSGGKVNRDMSKATGREIYEAVRGWEPSQAYASEWFRKQGLPGIRYADQGSRGKDGGTSNFVVFDDSILTIQERNGLGLLNAKPGPILR